MEFAGGVGIERFGAGDGKRVEACYEIYRATREADDPGPPLMPPRVFLGWLQVGFMGDPRETWLLEDAAGIGGWYLLELPARDNRHLGLLELAVSPRRQRHGLGTALLRHAAGRAIADGRELLAGLAGAGSPGEAFARSAGVAWGMNEIRRAADTDALPPERLAALRDAAQAASAGYSLVSWAGPTPEEHLDEVAELNRAGSDAPHDPSHQELVWDAARVRATDDRARRHGMVPYTVMAGHDASGEPAGLTMVEAGPERPQWGFQALTAVAREHRGHRLGLRLKLAMLDLLAEREPRVRHILTSNAETNAHMIGINEILGYRVIGRTERSWELPASSVVKA
ncbi:MAG TPA: GNAT family N-acetyltransferase [Streptosporangiaceae bacterium]|nr:GNAT family N-acetyltransferase [Streptosporangiaceae bacterium]